MDKNKLKVHDWLIINTKYDKGFLRISACNNFNNDSRILVDKKFLIKSVIKNWTYISKNDEQYCSKIDEKTKKWVKLLYE